MEMCSRIENSTQVISLFEQTEYPAIEVSPLDCNARPTVWAKTEHQSSDWYKNSIFANPPCKIQFVVKEECEFDQRIGRLRRRKADGFYFRVSKIRVVRPWAERFEYWAKKTYRYRSDDFARDFGKLFNKGKFNRRIYQSLVAEERSRDALKIQNRIKRANRLAWIRSQAKSYLLLTPPDAGEEVPSCVEEITNDPPIQKKPQTMVIDDESWFVPTGVIIGKAEKDETAINTKRMWRYILNNLRERLGRFVPKSSKKYYLSTTSPNVKAWAKTKFDITELSTNQEKSVNVADLQSATARAEEVLAECSEVGNTIFIEQSGKSVGSTVARNTNRMMNIIPDSSRMTSLSSRDIVIDTFEWTDKEPDTILRQYSLPAALWKLRSSNPTVIPFNIHTFSKCDMIIRIRANPNPFQIGQLQCSWLYDPDADANIANRLNIHTLSQTNHCLVNAGTGNIGEIYVKYINPLSCLPTIDSSVNDNVLNLGKLYITVLNKLRCPDTVAKSCYVTVSVELIDAVYAGAKDYSFGNHTFPQMEAMAAAVAVKAAENIFVSSNTPNNDKPPYQGSRVAMVPQSNQSFCLGTNLVEPINSLRLDARGQHVTTIDTTNEMTVDYVAKTYGFITSRAWSVDDKETSKPLFSMDASPLFDKSSYAGASIGSDTAYAIPPVGVISSLFSYWSGELRMRVDFVASKFHTGRLLVCYVPLYLQPITLEQAYSYPFQVFDLREGNQSFTFNIPYLSMLPMYPRRTGYTNVKDAYMPPGKIDVFVVNPLVAMENVCKEVIMNIYWAAGDNFKVFIPAQPSLVTSFFPSDSKPSTVVKAAEGMYPWHLGFSSSICQYRDGSNVFTPALVRYSFGWDDVTYFNNVNPKMYYKLKIANAHYAVLGKWKQGSNDELEDETNHYYKDLYFVPLFRVPFDMVGKLFGVCLSEEDMKNYFAALGTQGPYYDQKALTFLAGMKSTDTSGVVDGNPEFVGYSPQTVESDFELLTSSQMDERRVGGPDEELYADCKVYPVAASLNRELIGEDFNDLKTYMRRYQPYGVVTTTTTTKKYGDASFTFPALPTGLDVQFSSKLSDYPRYVREGPQQVILSGFRYYSGGMRFAISTTNDKFSLWVQHRADYEGPPSIKTITNGKTAGNLLNSGYAQYLQSLTVNNIVQFEVPYYKNRSCLYGQRIKKGLKRTVGASSLGQIYIGLEGADTPTKLTFSIFSSIADDFQAYSFQGFPTMIFVDDLQQDVSQTLRRQPFETKSQMPMINAEILHKLTVDDNLVESLKQAASSLQSVKPTIENLSTLTSSFFSDVISHIGHCIISPTKANIAWSLIHMFCKYGLMTMSSSESIFSKLLPCISKLFPSAPIGDPSELDIAGLSENERLRLSEIVREQGISGLDLRTTSQVGDQSSILIELGATIVALISGFYSERGFRHKDGSWYKPAAIISILSSGLSQSGRNHKSIVTFFQNIHKLICDIIEKITYYMNPKLLFTKYLKEEPLILSDWQESVERICDVRNEDYVFAQDSPWSEYVEEAYVFGVQIGKYFLRYIEGEADDSLNLKQGYSFYSKLFTRLCEVRADMLKRGISAVSRREPFCVWVAGKPGIGKSQLSSRLIPYLLKSVGIKTRGETTFTIQSGVDYWNGIRSQPCFLMDDFLIC
ncbi:MAG: capsid protein [Sanya Iflavirus 7]|nr:MAG: capsid protein [Sanya Iflavirus 7]